MSDPVKNFAYGELGSSITSTDTSLTFKTGRGSRFPSTSGGSYNVVIYDKIYGNAATAYHTIIDGNRQAEIVRFHSLSGDTVSSMSRGQEGTTALNFNTTGKLYVIERVLTALDYTNIAGAVNPEKTKFVSSTFSTAVSPPYYSDLDDAVNAAVSGDTIYVYPGTYSPFTVGVDNLKIVGLGKTEYVSGSGLVGGVIVSGQSSGAGKKRLYLENIGFQYLSGGDVWTAGSTASTELKHTYIGCSFNGSAFDNGYHGCLIQSGYGNTIERCSFYNSSHGLALRCAETNVSNVYIEDCGTQSGIIVKGESGSGSIYGVNISNVNIVATSANHAKGIIIQNVNSGTSVRWVNVNNVTADNINNNLILVQQTAGTTQYINISNCIGGGVYNDTFKIEGGADINFNNCQSASSDSGYGFNNSGGTGVSLINCISRSDSSGSISGTFQYAQITSGGEGQTYIGNGGTKIVGIYSNTATIDFGNISAGSYEDKTITVNGVVAGSAVILGLPTAPTVGIEFKGFVSADNTVTIRATNFTGSPINPASATYRATVIRH